VTDVKISRRQFASLASTAMVFPRAALAAKSLTADVAIIGGGTGGCAAALAALRHGLRVVMTEETDWVGGQLTSQCVPPDEHPWIENFGGTRLYRDYRRAVRQYYRDHFALKASLRQQSVFNPGGGSVSALTHEPPVSLAVIEAMLSPWLSSGQLTLLLRHRPAAAATSGDRITAVSLKDLETGATRVIEAPYFIDATEQGDLLPLAKVEYVTGFESRKETGEPSAPEVAQPANIQAFTICFSISYHPGEDHTIDKPDNYQFWRDYVPNLKPKNWPGKLLSWSMSNPITLEPRAVKFDPTESTGVAGPLNLWLYRRIRSKSHFEGDAGADISLINWPQNDYWLGNLHEVSDAEAARHLKGGRDLSLSLLYWMQTEAPAATGAGWKGLKLRGDQSGTADGLAKYPYIRESRRIKAEFTVVEQHVGTEARMKATGQSREQVTAETFADSVGIGSYRIDLHPSSGGDNYIDVSSLPFQIPMGALIPRRVENLLAASKNLGVTHITNGCYRLHPVEWNIGESAGALAAHAVKTRQTPRAIRNNEARRKEFQASLTAQGVELAWPRISPR
jgi:hypothetical protein